MKLAGWRVSTSRLVKRTVKSLGLREVALRFTFRRGIPPGLDTAALRQAVAGLDENDVKTSKYRQMSGWKKSGAYALRLRSRAHGKLSLVFKNASYAPDEIPALVGLPLTPGLGEYLFFRHATGESARYLPRIFFAEQAPTSPHYRYLMEDLSATHRALTSFNDRHQLCRALPAMHESFKDLADQAPFQQLARFDRAFNERLLTYTWQGITAYQQSRPSPQVDALLADWRRVATRIQTNADEVYRNEPLTLIHGDCNLSNAMCDKRSGAIKVLDLEWAGWGLPHQDLASVLHGAPEELEAQCVAEYSASQGADRLARDWRNYRFCVIQRALLDAGFIARQMLDRTARVPQWFPNLINASCANVMQMSRVMKMLMCGATCAGV